MVRSILVVGIVALGVGAAIAQANVIEQRQNIMKRNWDVAKPVFGMMRGQVAFNLEQVQSALRTISQNAKQIPTLFPDNSKTGGDTEALPAIWENKADFNARAARLEESAQAALAAIKDEATFKTEFPKAAQTCDGCHDKYRKPTS
jgi:cytochrome c556